MIKFLKSIHTILAILFVVVNMFLLIFNWGVFTVSLEINYGFGSFSGPPILIMMVFGFVIVAMIWFTDYIKDLRTEINILKKDEELGKLKGAVPTNGKEMDDKFGDLQTQVDDLKNFVKANERLQDRLQPNP